MISLVLEQFFEYEKRLTYIEGFPIQVDSIFSFLRSPAILLMLSQASQNKQRSKGNWTGIIIVATRKKKWIREEPKTRFDDRNNFFLMTEIISSTYLD